MSLFECTSPLTVSAEEAFAWHARPGAFERLCPPWQRLEVIERTGDGIEEGSRLAFRLYRGPLPVTWVAEHRDLEPGRLFRDVQLRGPFARWRHSHRFVPRPEGSELRDEIDYRLPLGSLGNALGGGVVRRDLERVFTFRHRTTREDLELHARHRDRPTLRVAVAGAGGLLGTATRALLTTGGHRVVRLVRGGAAGAAADDTVAWDPERGLARPEELEGVDAVVYLAGENIGAGPWTPARKERLVASRVDAVRRLVEQLGTLGRPPRSFVCASGISYFGDRGSDPVDEASARGGGFLAELAARWEEAAAGAALWGARVVTLRFGVVLSPRGGALAKMLPAFRAGLGGPLGSGRQQLSWISLDDAAGAVLHALHTDYLDGPVVVTAPRPVSQRRFAATLGRVLRRPACLPTPAAALRLAFGEMAEETLLSSTHALPVRLLGTGYRFRQPELADALGHCLGKQGAGERG